jgi:Mce-associated membrane protein
MTAVTKADVHRDDPPGEAEGPDPVGEPDQADDSNANDSNANDSKADDSKAATESPASEPAADEPAQSGEPDGSDDAVAAPAGARRLVLHGYRLAVVLVVGALLLGAAGAWFFTQARATRAAPAAQNSALVDTGTTAEVSAAITNSLNRVFSYSYDKPSVTEEAAAQALRGPALDTYNRLFAQVREQAPQQKIVLSTRVVNIAVQSLTGDRAQLLVFLDQSATRADNNTTSTGAAQLSVTAQRQDGSWVIIDLTPR